MIEPTSQELANWFFSSGTWRKQQGPDGFDYSKDNGGYVYIWIMAHVDMDLEQHYLLDVRVSQPDDKWEDRHFLYVRIDGWDGITNKYEVVGDTVHSNASPEVHLNRHKHGLHTFADLVVVR